MTEITFKVIGLFCAIGLLYTVLFYFTTGLFAKTGILNINWKWFWEKNK